MQLNLSWQKGVNSFLWRQVGKDEAGKSQKTMWERLGVMDLFIISIVLTILWEYKYVKNYWIA